MFRPSKEKCACGNEKSQVAKVCAECRRRRITIKCEVCGSEFETKPGKAKRTCSRTCADRLRANASSNTQCRKVDIICEHCGRTKSVSPSYSKRRFCSRRCAYDAASGENHRNWKGGISGERDLFFSSREWKVAQQYVWARDKRTCQRCGVIHESGERAFEVHHIASWAKFPELRTDVCNLILLCRGCHQWVHSRANEERQFIRLKRDR